MGNSSTNLRCSRVSLRKGKDYGVMAKILDLKFDGKIGVHTLMLHDNVVSGMSLFFLSFNFFS